MQRREFIGLIGGAAVWPLAAQAQQNRTFRLIGVLHAFAPNSPEFKRRLGALTEGLRKLGWIEGRDIKFEIRTAVGQMDRLPALAAELVALNVDIIVSSGVELIQAAQKATSTIPIVMSNVGDAIGAHLIDSLSHPGGNITGLTLVASEQSTKRLELLKEIMPTVERVGILWNGKNDSHKSALEAMRPAIPPLKLSIQSLPTRNTAEIEEAIQTAVKGGAQAFVTMDDQLIQFNASRIVELATKERIPVVGEFRNLAEAGAIFSYSPNIPGMWGHAAIFVDKIFKGEKPGDLPVEQPTKFELVINLKTAKVIGLAIPATVLTFADEVIE